MTDPVEPLSAERIAQIQRELAEMRVDAKHPIVLHIFDGIEGLLGMVEALTAEIDRLRVANDQLAQLLADRDQREDTLNDDIAALQAENQAWQSYATWSCTRDDRTYPCGDCDGCRAGVWNSCATADQLRAVNEALLIKNQTRERALAGAVAQGHALQVRIDAALSLHPRIDHTRITPEFSCEECGVHYPCPTVAALTGDQQGATDA